MACTFPQNTYKYSVEENYEGNPQYEGNSQYDGNFFGQDSYMEVFCWMIRDRYVYRVLVSFCFIPRLFVFAQQCLDLQLTGWMAFSEHYCISYLLLIYC